jgi:hypothetical protein
VNQDNLETTESKVTQAHLVIPVREVNLDFRDLLENRVNLDHLANKATQACLVTRVIVDLLDPLDHKDLQATKDHQESKEKWE